MITDPLPHGRGKPRKGVSCLHLLTRTLASIRKGGTPKSSVRKILRFPNIVCCFLFSRSTIDVGKININTMVRYMVWRGCKYIKAFKSAIYINNSKYLLRYSFGYEAKEPAKSIMHLFRTGSQQTRDLSPCLQVLRKKKNKRNQGKRNRKHSLAASFRLFLSLRSCKTSWSSAGRPASAIKVCPVISSSKILHHLKQKCAEARSNRLVTVKQIKQDTCSIGFH